MPKKQNYSDMLIENILVVFDLYGDELECDADKLTAVYQQNTGE